MMRIAFTANEVGYELDEEAVVCGLRGGEEWITFQTAEGVSDEPGIYVEYLDQINGGYGCIASCRLDQQSLSVDLCKQLGSLASVNGFDVILRLDSKSHAILKSGMQRIFRDAKHLFTLSS